MNSTVPDEWMLHSADTIQSSNVIAHVTQTFLASEERVLLQNAIASVLGSDRHTLIEA